MQANGKETALIDALNQIAKERGIDKQLIYETIEASLVSACKKHYGAGQNIRVAMDRTTGAVEVFIQKEVVETVSDEQLEISLEKAHQINELLRVGDICEISVTPKDFGRIAAQTAKQVVMQKFREAERELIYNEFITKEKEIITGIVQRKEHRNIIVGLGKIDACLPPNEQILREDLALQARIKVYVTEVKQTSKGPQISVSRNRPELVKRLFENEVPEVGDGTVIIKSISREAGSRSKISVYSRRDGVDPVGACVGPNGSRVNIVVSELKGEKIDIIPYNEDPAAYIASALSPSKVVEVLTNERDMTARVIVPDHQLSLAIGKEGQNARLAAKLTGWKIDIKSETQAKELEYEEYEDDYDEEYDDYDEEYDDGYDEEYDDDYDEEYDGEYDDGYDGEYDNGEYESRADAPEAENAEAVGEPDDGTGEEPDDGTGKGS